LSLDFQPVSFDKVNTMRQPKNIIRKTILAAGAAIAAALAPANAQEAPQAEPQSVMMVLDGSGSMWGQIDGVAKIEIARDVIGGLLDGWSPNLQLGVMAYGHRVKGSCDDIETLIDVGPVDRTAIMAKVNAINPKGKTPISASVRKAAEALKYTEEKATVILVSDGLETCNADPCALANELEAAGVDFTTHVIGFDITEEEKAGLSCLAENTGGRFISAGNANELTTALTETVQIVAQAEPEPVNEGPQGVRVRAKLCETCDIVEDNMFWWVNETEQDLEGNRKEVTYSGSATKIFELPARDYQIVARYGGVAFTTTEITVEPGKLTDLVLNLNAGHFRVNAALTVGGDILKDTMFYWIYETKTDLEGNRKEVTYSGSATKIFRLPAGDYLVRARHGNAFAEQTITVKAGELTDLTFDMNAGYLRVQTTMSTGGVALEKDMFYWILQPEVDFNGNRKEVTYSGSAKQLFRLPAGEYILRSRHGKAFKDTPVTVTAGGVTDTMVVQNSGRVKVSAVQTKGGPALTSGVFWWVYQPTGDLEGTETEIDYSGTAEPILILPAGDYILAVRYGGEITRANMSLKSGEEKKVEVLLNP
jgi:Ca-activated chloride channel homolog